MRAIHVGRNAIENGFPPEDCIVVSITDPRSRPAAIKPTPRILAIHRVLPFHDVDVEGERILRMSSTTPLEHYIAFEETRARKLAEFIKSFDGKQPPLFVAHCEAGICRSAGVVAAVQTYYELPGVSAFVTGLPNSLVYRLTLQALRGEI